MIVVSLNNFLYVEDTREIFNENIIPDLNSIVSSYLPNFNTCKYIFSWCSIQGILRINLHICKVYEEICSVRYTCVYH